MTLCGIQAFEVWNEENALAYWTGSEGQYETLLQVAYQQLHPLGVTVVLGGTTHKGADLWDSTLLNAEHNTTGKQCLGGPHGDITNNTSAYGYCFNVLGVHTYPKSNQRTMLGTSNMLSNLTNSPDIPTVLNGTTSNTESDHVCTATGTAVCVDTIGRLINDLNNRGLNTVPIWITEMGANTSDGWIDDQQVANMLTNFYKYINGIAVPTTGGGTSTCSNCLSRIQVAMWFIDNLPVSSEGYGYNFLDPTFITSDTTLIPKPAYAEFVNLP